MKEVIATSIADVVDGADNHLGDPEDGNSHFLTLCALKDEKQPSAEKHSLDMHRDRRW